MWVAQVQDTVQTYPQTTYIIVASLVTLAFVVWCYTSRASVPPESRRSAAFVMVCAHLFAYNLYGLVVHDTGDHLWGCVFALVLLLCVMMVWPLPRDYRPVTEDDYREMA